VGAEPVWALWRKDKSLVLPVIELIFFGRPICHHTAYAIAGPDVGMMSGTVV